MLYGESRDWRAESAAVHRSRISLYAFKATFFGWLGRRMSTLRVLLPAIPIWPTIAEIGKHRNQHSEMLVDFTLRKGNMEFHFATIRRSDIVRELVSRHLSAVYPFIKKTSPGGHFAEHP